MIFSDTLERLIKEVDDIFEMLEDFVNSDVINTLRQVSTARIMDVLNKSGGVSTFNTEKELRNSFYDLFQDIYNVSDNALYYVDIESFITDCVISGDFSIFYIRKEGMLALVDNTGLSSDISDTLEQLSEEIQEEIQEENEELLNELEEFFSYCSSLEEELEQISEETNISIEDILTVEEVHLSQVIDQKLVNISFIPLQHDQLTKKKIKTIRNKVAGYWAQELINRYSDQWERIAQLIEKSEILNPQNSTNDDYTIIKG